MTTTCRLGTVDSDDNPWDYPSRIVTYVGAGEAIYEDGNIRPSYLSLDIDILFDREAEGG